MPSVSKEELLRLVTFSVLAIFQLLNFRENLSTVAYKAVAYKKKLCTKTWKSYKYTLSIKITHIHTHGVNHLIIRSGK